MTGPAQSARRLMVAAGTYCDAEAALALVGPLLELLPMQLAGLYAEERLDDLALVKDQRVVSASGTLVELPPRDRARGVAAGEARAFRKSLAKTAATRAAQWSFEAASGDLIARVCASVTGDDVLLLGHRPILRPRGPVLHIGSIKDKGTEARHVAEAMARALSTAVKDVLAAENDSPLDALRRVDRSHAAMVVADFRAGPLSSEAELRRLLNAARCPVTVFGAATIGRAPQT